MGRAHSPPSRREASVSWAIMGVLAIIAVGVFIKQFYYDPTLFIPSIVKSQAPGEAVLESLPSSDIAEFVPDDMGVVSPVESFGPETLSDKINGKAELYLSAGFLNLRCQRFAQHADPQSWMEVFIYDMGTLRQSFAVFSAQRRSEAHPLELTPFSYRTQNALFWVHGRHYVEIIASVPSEVMMETMLSFGTNFVRKTPVEAENIGELELFPSVGLKEGSFTLLISDAFGFQDFKNVFTASYQVEAEEVTAFLSEQRNPEDAESLVAAYHAFLLRNGGTEVPLSVRVANASLVEILGAFELIFSHGRYVAGIHEAGSQKTAEKLGLMIKMRLDGFVKSP